MAQQRSFRVGDRVKVAGGYDQDPQWPDGGGGYDGSVEAIEGRWAVIALDSPVRIQAPTTGWEDFGDGAAVSLGKTQTAGGSWLAVGLAYKAANWSHPVTRLHVSVCVNRPDLSLIPEGGGVGVWVESHATMLHT